MNQSTYCVLNLIPCSTDTTAGQAGPQPTVCCFHRLVRVNCIIFLYWITVVNTTNKVCEIFFLLQVSDFIERQRTPKWVSLYSALGLQLNRNFYTSVMAGLYLCLLIKTVFGVIWVRSMSVLRWLVSGLKVSRHVSRWNHTSDLDLVTFVTIEAENASYQQKNRAACSGEEEPCACDNRSYS